MHSGEVPAHSSLVLPKPIPDLAAEEFHLFQALVLRESGIHLGAKNRAMLVSRLWKRLRALELNSFASYYRRVKADPQEMVLMLDCICTNETHFFREPAAFDCLRTRVFPEWAADADAGKRGKTLRVWSAACSTGEEFSGNDNVLRLGGELPGLGAPESGLRRDGDLHLPRVHFHRH